jgi:hypothetical protein
VNPGEGLTSRLWQALAVVAAFTITLRLASAIIRPTVGLVLWFFIIITVYVVLLGRHRR